MFGKKQSGSDPTLSARVASIAGTPVSRASTSGTAPRFTPSQGRAPREPTYKTGVVVNSNGERIQVVVKNINSGGARVDFFKRIPLSDEVLLSVGGLTQVKARVVWQDEGSAGLKFV